MTDALQNARLSAERIEEVIAPFLDARHPLSSGHWKREERWQLQKWRYRSWKSRYFGWIPGVIRSQAYVEKSYSANWSSRPWPVTNAGIGSDPKPSWLAYGGESWIVRRGGQPRVHLDSMARVIEQLRPRSVLELGSGSGVNLFVLASKFPDVKFSGLELTASGVEQSTEMQRQDRLPPVVRSYIPWNDFDEQAYKRIEFVQGSATAIPYPDKHFDLVFTRVALEQMNMIRESVLTETARVARAHTLHVEPFTDFNRTQLQRNYVAAKGYFCLSVAEMTRFGLTPIAAIDSFPQNMLLGIGMALFKTPHTN